MNIDSLIKFYDWNDDLDTMDARLRGLYRALTGLIVFAVGVPIFILAVSGGLTGVGMIGALVSFFGISTFPCAAVEILLNRSWSETPRAIRIVTFLLGLFLFVIIFLLTMLAALALAT